MSLRQSFERVLRLEKEVALRSVLISIGSKLVRIDDLKASQMTIERLREQITEGQESTSTTLKLMRQHTSDSQQVDLRHS